MESIMIIPLNDLKIVYSLYNGVTLYFIETNQNAIKELFKSNTCLYFRKHNMKNNLFTSFFKLILTNLEMDKFNFFLF